MSLTVTILGCGSSGGVPRVGQGWGACDPKNAKNRRRRCSILVEREGANGMTRVLIDMSPDLRAQLLDCGIKHLDAILLTHPHADHTHGIDEVRPLVLMAKKRIDLYMDAATAAVVRSHFGYIFETPEGSFYPALLTERRSLRHCGFGRRHRIRSVPARAWRNRRARLSLRPRGLYAGPQRDPAGEPTFPAGPRPLDCRCLALHAASEPFHGLRSTRLDRPFSPEARDPDQSSYGSRFRPAEKRAAGPCPAGIRWIAGRNSRMRPDRSQAYSAGSGQRTCSIILIMRMACVQAAGISAGFSCRRIRQDGGLKRAVASAMQFSRNR